MSLGPVQVLVVGFEAPAFTGEALAELARLSEAGIVRLVDVMLVQRADDGTIDTLPVPEGFDPSFGRVAAALLAGATQPERGEAEPGAEASATSGAEAPVAPTWSLADAVPVGTTAAVALIEHVWAAPLLGAIRRAGGSPLEEAWLAADDLAALEDLRAR